MRRPWLDLRSVNPWTRRRMADCFLSFLHLKKKLATQAPMAGSQSSQSVATQMDTQARFGYFHTYISFQYIYIYTISDLCAVVSLRGNGRDTSSRVTGQWAHDVNIHLPQWFSPPSGVTDCTHGSNETTNRGDVHSIHVCSWIELNEDHTHIEH